MEAATVNKASRRRRSRRAGPESFSEAVRASKEASGLGWPEWAGRHGVAESTARAWADGRRRGPGVRVRRVRELAVGLGLDPDDAVGAWVDGSLPDLIRARKQVLGVSWPVLAEGAGLSVSGLSAWVDGRRGVGDGDVSGLASALGVSVEVVAGVR